MHLDLDVLDPAAMPGLHWPGRRAGSATAACGRCSPRSARVANVIGVEITNLPQAALARRVATIAEPLMPIPETR